MAVVVKTMAVGLMVVAVVAGAVVEVEVGGIRFGVKEVVMMWL